MKRIQGFIKHYGLEQETLVAIIYEETGSWSASASCAGNDYVIKYSANLGKDYALDSEVYFYVTKRVKGHQLLGSRNGKNIRNSL